MIGVARVGGLSRLWLCVLLAGMLVLSGCTSGGEQSEPPQPDGNITSGAVPDAGGAVDPQVLDDVVAAAFPVPGPSMRRMMRVTNFASDFIGIACGSTERLSIDRTSERYSQGEFPDLELIRTKGFVEEDPVPGRPTPPPGYRKGCNSRSKGNLRDTMPSYDAWLNLTVGWDEVVATIEQDPSVVALKAPFAQCLLDGTKGTGIEVSSVDPARTFVASSDLAYYKNEITTAERQRRIPRLYARCGEAYFGRTQELLEAERPANIERHRELLERAARELVAMGYVP